MLRLKPNPGGSVVKNPPASAGAAEGAVLIPELGRSSLLPLRYSCLENPMDKGAWRATVQGASKSWTATEHTHNTGKTIQCRGIQEDLAMEKVVKVCSMSLCSHSHPSHSYLLCSVLYPTSTRLLPSSFWLESLKWEHQQENEGRKKTEDGESVYSVPSLQDCCPLSVPWPEVLQISLSPDSGASSSGLFRHRAQQLPLPPAPGNLHCPSWFPHFLPTPL